MNVKRIISVFVSFLLLAQGVCVFADNMSTDEIREKQLEFASQYNYKEGDSDKSFELYPGIIYTSGLEYREDGTAYECPAIYADEHAQIVGSYDLKYGEAAFIINNTETPYYDRCILYNDRLLAPIDAFKLVGCEVDFDTNTYVARVSNGETVLEILPNLIGMRKNQADGFYVPLEVCARLIDDTLYVPLRAVADEMGIKVSWDGETNTAYMITTTDVSEKIKNTEKQIITRSGLLPERDIDDVILRSDLIIFGTVNQILGSRWTAPELKSGILQTDLLIDVNEVLYGETTDDTIKLRIDKGEDEDTIVIDEFIPDFTVGEESLLFLARDDSALRTDEDYYVLTTYEQSKYVPQDDGTALCDFENKTVDLDTLPDYIDELYAQHPNIKQELEEERQRIKENNAVLFGE